MSDRTVSTKKSHIPLRSGDIVIIAAVLAAAGILSAACAAAGRTDAAGSFAVITTPDGTRELPLSTDTALKLEGNGHTLTAVISGGGIYVKESDCPDGVCVAEGKASLPGEMIVCLPAGIMITIKGGQQPEGFDAVAG